MPTGSTASVTGNDNDAYHFAMLDHDYGSADDHAQFREYGEVSGRWMSPDPYSGSYDATNPQSFNRYAYVNNNPLGANDPTGQDWGVALCVANPAACVVGLVGSAILDDWLISLFFGPTFHGSIKPRPEATGTPDYGNADGSFGESLGVPKGLPKIDTSEPAGRTAALRIKIHSQFRRNVVNLLLVGLLQAPHGEPHVSLPQKNCGVWRGVSF